jgi:hypothetical protein
MSVTVVPEARTASTMRSLTVRSWLSNRRTSPASSSAIRFAFELDRSRWPNAVQGAPGLGGRQQAAGATRRQATEQGVKPTDRLGPQTGEVVVPVGQQPQHRGAIHRSDLAQPAVT